MLLNAQQIKAAVEAKQVQIEPYIDDQIEAASYDLRVGKEGITTTEKQLVDIEQRGLLSVRAGDFAVLTTDEVIELDAQHTARIGLRSKYARKGIVATTGPQIDPGFRGRLMVGIINLSPQDVSFSHHDSFLSIELHKLSSPTHRPYDGPFQGRLKLGPDEIEQIAESSRMSMSGVMETLQHLAKDVSVMSASISSMKLWTPIICVGSLAVFTSIVSFLMWFFK